jgi:hypothetical protein
LEELNISSRELDLPPFPRINEHILVPWDNIYVLGKCEMIEQFEVLRSLRGEVVVQSPEYPFLPTSRVTKT